MAIYQLLQNSAFGPEAIQLMADAYERAFAESGLQDRNDPLAETLAKFIIEIAQTGERDSRTISALALHRMKEPDQGA